MRKIDKIIVTILLFILIGIFGWNMYNRYQVEDKFYKINNEVESLELQIGTKNIKLKTAEIDLKIAQTELALIRLKYNTDESYIKEIEIRYRKLYTYAFVAEEVLSANGIEFWRIDDGLDLSILRGKAQ